VNGRTSTVASDPQRLRVTAHTDRSRGVTEGYLIAPNLMSLCYILTPTLLFSVAIQGFKDLAMSIPT